MSFPDMVQTDPQYSLMPHTADDERMLSNIDQAEDILGVNTPTFASYEMSPDIDRKLSRLIDLVELA